MSSLLSIISFSSLLLLLVLSQTPITAGKPVYWCCSTDASYTNGSAFQSNLNRLLSSATPPTGFSNTTIGQSPDTVYGLTWCRGDVSSDKCQSCLATALAVLPTVCPLGMSAFLWYDHCILQYCDQSFFDVADTSVKYWLWIPNNVPDVTSFDDVLGKLMDNLTTAAARSARKFAAGPSDLDSFTKIYGLVQCTLDLTPDSCYRCLQAFVMFIKSCCGGRKEGAQFLGENCYLRYEIYLFYNTNTSSVSALTAAPPPPAPTAGGSLQASSVGGDSSHGSKLAVIIAIPVATVALLLLGICCSIIWKRRKTYRKVLRDTGADDNFKTSESLLLDLATLRAATNNFSDANKLGEGGFGPVYKGELGNGEVIAVKRLAKTSGQGLVEPRNEVVLVAKLQHRNLVRLLGFCLQENEKMLVYEYLPNTSLDKFLFDPLKRPELDWQRRFKIIEGIARGLLYLHEDSRLRIIHRDLKASNILLDVNMNPKISDFGLAKLFGIDETHRNASRIAGTLGYMAPEYALHGLFSTKSDVFSYGVLVLEIITGQRSTSFRDSGLAANLLSYVWVHWNEGTVLQLRDPSLGDLFSTEELLRCVHIGLLCVQGDHAERPSMASVVLMLSSLSVTLPNPATPAFFLGRSSTTESKVRSANGQLDLSEKGHSTGSMEIPMTSKSVSVNSVTISEMEPDAETESRSAMQKQSFVEPMNPSRVPAETEARLEIKSPDQVALK